MYYFSWYFCLYMATYLISPFAIDSVEAEHQFKHCNFSKGDWRENADSFWCPTPTLTVGHCFLFLDGTVGLEQ